MISEFAQGGWNPSRVVALARGDVTGDRISDTVYLIGIKTPDSPFVQQITLHIQDGKSGRVTRIPLQENAGYNPTIFLGDFTGDGVDNILIGVASGGSGGIMYYYIYSFVNQIVRLLFDFEAYNEQYQYEVEYQDDYKVEVVSNINNEKYIIDISTRDPEYLNEIYYKNGKLKSPITGFVNLLSGLHRVDFDSDNQFELLAYQKIAGRYNADSLGYVLNTLVWWEDRFVLQSQFIAIYGDSNPS